MNREFKMRESAISVTLPVTSSVGKIFLPLEVFARKTGSF